MTSLTKRNIARVILGIAIATAFCWIGFRHTNWSATVTILRNADPLLLGCALAALSFDYLARVTRWWLMLRELSPGLPLVSTFGPFLASIALNNVLPLRAGDVIRTVGFTQRLGMPAMGILGTMVLERLLDLGSLLLYFFIALSLAAHVHAPATFVHGVMLASIAFVITSFGVALLPGPILSKLSPIVATGRGSKPLLFAVQLLEAVGVFRSPVLTVRIATLSVAIWLLEGTVFLFVGQALNVNIPPVGNFVALTMGTLSTLIPGTPGYVGTFDYFTAMALSFFGVEKSLATSYVIAIHAMLWAPLTTIGLALLIGMKKSQATANPG